MVNTKISALPTASTIAGTELLPLVQGGATKAVTVTQLLALITAGAPGNLDTFFEVATQMGLDETTVTTLQALVAGKTSPADVDTKIATQAAVDAGTYALRLARANRVATMGDSISGLNGSAYTVTTGRQFRNNYGFLLIAGLKGRARLTGQYGYAGQTTPTIRDSVLPVILGLPAGQKPGTVIILTGTNDVSGTTVTLTQSMSALNDIYVQLRANGIRMVCCTIPPKGDDTASNVRVGAFNMAVRKFAADRGLPLLPFHTALVDPATGKYLAAYDNGDGVHPSPQGMAAMAKAAIDAGIADIFPHTTVETVKSVADSTDLLAGAGLNLTDSNADGLADMWTAGGAAPYTASLVTPTTGDGVAGKWQRITTTGGTQGTQVYFQNFFFGLTASAGDLISVTARLRITGATAAAIPANQPVTFAASLHGGTGSDFTEVGASVDMDGLVNLEMRAVAGDNSIWPTVTTWSPGGALTMTVDVAEVAVRNLTALGLDN